MTFKFPKNKPLLLDGATGTELEKHGVSLNDKLWSGIAVISEPKKLEEVYLDYLNCGSELIETATYQLTKKGLIKHDLDPHSTYQKAIDIADSARQKHFEKTGKKAMIVGSIGPFGAYLADGAEFTGHYPEITNEEMKAFHSDRLDYLYNSPLVDLIGFETIPSFEEVKSILEMMKTKLDEAKKAGKPYKPYYLALSCSPEMVLADGSLLHKVLEYINGHLEEILVAVGANCCGLRTSKVLIEKFDLEFGNFHNLDRQCRIVIYPNSGEIYDGITKEWIMDDKLGTTDLQQAFREAAEVFLSKKRLGLVGGCCRTGPAQIKLLREMIDEKK